MSNGTTHTTPVKTPEPPKEVNSVGVLAQAFLRNFPKDAARKLESLSPDESASILNAQTAIIRLNVWLCITPATATEILLLLPDSIALDLLLAQDAGPSASILSRMESEQREHYFSLMSARQSQELRDLMEYPLSTAGYLMETKTLALSFTTSVANAITQLRYHPINVRRRIYILDDDMLLYGQIDLEQLVVAKPEQTLKELSHPIGVSVVALDPKEDVAEKLEQNAIEILPVVDIHNRLLGVIRGSRALDVLKEDIAGDLQTMVGVSRDEQALSSSIFAVRKRQPWLQINLLTGFLAAAVVGLFEGTIAQFTALAVLMPVAAGQSGNTGAQALAVTMRGLTLREITIRDWLKVTAKEASAGFINGIAIAATCGLGVYVWSRSIGLSLILALAMIISMTIAGIAGALVPMCLKKLGQDPAQSSSIILTTVTDIAGFMSFLGIAALLAKYLV